MNRKAIAFFVIVGIALVLGLTLRTTNRADASPGDCYSDSKGPSEPTICS